ncbi:hypothetical protein KY334_00140 [Candidatus Woesearchaeota archaeon]|nr:hypothetical protein [Candidatus Woesearchaeota archaeon]
MSVKNKNVRVWKVYPLLSASEWIKEKIALDFIKKLRMILIERHFIFNMKIKLVLDYYHVLHLIIFDINRK